MAITNGQTADADDINAELSALANNISALDSAAVKLTGNQTVQGVKTFGSIPVLPASDPTSGNQAVRKAYVDARIDMQAGTALISSADTERNYGFYEWAKKKEIKIFNKGVYRVKFSAKGSSVSQYLCARIFKNGAAYGTLRTPQSTNYIEYSEDLAFEEGDACQLYLQGDNTWTIYAKEFRLYVAFKQTPDVIIN